ncbi:MAG TPA: hypothetical protein PLQ76_07150 [bacterium]|nr:hypothetical protein [bacterium]
MRKTNFKKISVLSISAVAAVLIFALRAAAYSPFDEKAIKFCAEDPQLCDTMKEMRSFCRDNGKYCLQKRDPKRDRGLRGDDGRWRSDGNSLMKNPMKRGDLRDYSKAMVDFAKGFKRLCESGDRDACNIVREAVIVVRDCSGYMREDSGFVNDEIMSFNEKRAEDLMPVIKACRDKKAGKTCTDEKLRLGRVLDSLKRSSKNPRASEHSCDLMTIQGLDCLGKRPGCKPNDPKPRGKH